MKLPGYQRRPPDPISVGVMAATPRKWLPAPLPRPRWHLACKLRGHKPYRHHLTQQGSKWSVVVLMCQRCNKPLEAKAGTQITL